MKLQFELPEEWKYIKLNSVLTLDIQNGYSPVCPDEPNDHWILSLGNLTENGFDPSQVKPAPTNDIRLKDFHLNPGDFLISRSNTLDKVGRTILFRGEIKNCSYPDLLMRFRVDQTLVLNDYLEHYLRSSLARRYIQNSASGTSQSMVKINKQSVKNIPILLPPLPEQKAIADLLATWDEAFEKTERLIRKKKRQFSALLKSLIEEKYTINSEARTYKKVSLSDVCTILSSNVDKKTKIGEQPVFLCNYMDVYNNLYIGSNISFMKASASHNEINKFKLRKNDVILTKDSETPEDIAQSACVIDELKNVICGYHLVILRPKQQLDGSFLNYYLHLPRTRYEFSRHANGATRFGLTMDAYDKVKIHLPTLHQQKKIAYLLKKAYQEIDILRVLSEKYKIQKLGLMQQLLTGKWRIRPESLEKYREVHNV